MSDRGAAGGQGSAGLGTFLLVPVMAATLFAAWHLAVVLTVEGIAVGDVDVTWAALRNLEPLAGLPARDGGAADTGATLRMFAALGLGALLLLCALVYWLAPVFDRGGRRGSSMEAQRSRSRRWARPHDVKDLLVDTDQLEDRAVFGLLDGKPVAGPRHGSVGVVAPAGAGKTATVVVPTVLRWRGPAVVTSVKADVLQLTLARRRALGPVWIFDPGGATGETSCAWSPLGAVVDYASAMRAASWIADSSKVQKGGDDHAFWEDLGEQLLAPLLLLAARTGRTMTDVARWVLTRDEDQVTRLLAELDDPDATAYWQGIRANVERTKHSIFLTAQRILAPFAHPDVRGALDVRAVDGGPDGHLKDLDAGHPAGMKDRQVFTPGALLDAAGTLYIVAPAGEQAELAPVFETLVNAVVREVERRSAGRGGLPIERRLLLMLDEAANIAPLKGLPRIASAGRGQGMVVFSVWQSLAQVDKIYGKSTATEVRDNHESWCYLPGIKDDETLRYLSQLIGRDEFTQTSRSVGADGRSSKSHSTSEHDVAPMSGLRELSDGQMIVMVRNKKPMLLRAHGWFVDRQLRALIPVDVAAGFDREFGGKPTASRRVRRTSGAAR